MSNYWTATDDIRRSLGGKNPVCPHCGKEMSPEDDHGNFKCFSCPSFSVVDGFAFARPITEKDESNTQNPEETGNG